MQPISEANLLSSLTASIIRAGALDARNLAAANLLSREIERRTRLSVSQLTTWGEADELTFILATTSGLETQAFSPGPTPLLMPSGRPEGFAIATGTHGGRGFVSIVGQDSRGLLFGVGHLLRQLRCSPGLIELPDQLKVVSSPQLPMRGHQLGYRPKTNSYDAWDVDQWHQYICDLAIFGTNAIEIVPPRTDDEATSPHFPLPQLRMMQEVSSIADNYDLDCWIWYPALDAEYTDPAIRDAALAEWEEVFRTLRRIDAVFVPGGDPGKTEPGVLMDFLALQAERLHRHHPKAQMWVSPQGFNMGRLEEWLTIVETRPPWLHGVVYGPWTRLPLPEFRARIPAKYPLRLYPDIAHTYLCQFPVADWDAALAATLGREPVNPRPVAFSAIIRKHIPHADGIISYSEGCNDDVNKIVWSALSWNPDADLREILEEYARYYLSPAVAADFADGLFALERNWMGPVAENHSIERTLEGFQALEREATPALLRNWRFLQGLYRAYFDAYIRRRLLKEIGEEQSALEMLWKAPTSGALAAMAAAEQALFAPSPELNNLRTRIFQLAEALFQTIGMQLSVPLYKATTTPRGANLDTVDLPLNNRNWLRDQFARIRQIDDEPKRLKELEGIANWQDPGPEGFYDNLGSSHPHLVQTGENGHDPEYRHQALLTHTIRTGDEFEDWRVAWLKHVSAFYESSVRMKYSDLDRSATYQLRVVYVPSFIPSDIKLEVPGICDIHDWLSPGVESRTEAPIVREFKVPRTATAAGTLDLKWSVNPNAGELVGFGQIAEVWLTKIPEN